MSRPSALHGQSVSDGLKMDRKPGSPVRSEQARGSRMTLVPLQTREKTRCRQQQALAGNQPRLKQSLQIQIFDANDCFFLTCASAAGWNG